MLSYNSSFNNRTHTSIIVHEKKPNCESRVLVSQSTQVQTHGQNSRLRELSLGQKVMARNYETGEKWISGSVKREQDHCHEVETTEKGVWRRHIDQLYGKGPKAGNNDCEVDLDVSYELDETSVEPQEAAGEECETDPDQQEEIPIIVAAPAEPDYPIRGTLPISTSASSGTVKKYPTQNCHRPELLWVYLRRKLHVYLKLIAIKFTPYSVLLMCYRVCVCVCVC